MTRVDYIFVSKSFLGAGTALRSPSLLVRSHSKGDVEVISHEHIESPLSDHLIVSSRISLKSDSILLEDI